jgi:exopolyphosphatase / guanosine-5'-triphosphate,3'-diphosphate pyrophosphatase
MVAYACIDIGSNTTRLLVAELDQGRWRELINQKAFTRLGKGLASGGQIPQERIEATADEVAKQVKVATDLGADQIEVVATAAVRRAPNREDFERAVLDRTGLGIRVVKGKEEAQLSFVGATKRLGAPAEGQIAVIDVGGGSTEIAIGTVDGGVSWGESFRIGSGFLADSYLHSDPPGMEELRAVRSHAEGAFEGLELPALQQAIATGGSATSLKRVAGAELGHEALERALRVLSSTPVEDVARRFDMEPDRARVLPAGALLLEVLSDRVGLPLNVSSGVLREGVILEMLSRDHGVQAA